jgi:tRNA pseudouridine38-40 synthase
MTPSSPRPTHGAGARGPRTSLLLRCAYDGSLLHGVTPQRGLPTVADALRARVEEAFGHRARCLVVAARTDAGVHAVENLATCWLGAEVDPAPALARLSEARADGLLAVQGRVVPHDVFARSLGGAKRYRYRLEGGHDPALIAHLRELDLAGRADPTLPRLPAPYARAWQVALPLDPAPMRRAAAHMVGRHDWTGFKVGPLGGRSPVRAIHAITLHALARDGHPHLVIDLEGEGFLRKMVRILVGTLAEVGAGLRDPDEIPALIAARDRQRTGQAALARGLCLLGMQSGAPWFEGAWTEPPGLPPPPPAD